MKNLQKINLIVLLVLGLASILNVGLPVAGAEESKNPPTTWQSVELKGCSFSALSKYHPYQAFCTSSSKTGGYYDLNLVDLKNPNAPLTQIYSDNVSFRYEDQDSGAMYVIFSGGDFGRFDASFSRDNYLHIDRGPNDYITDSIIRSAGQGTGVLFFRWSSFNYWFSSYDNGLTWQQRFENEDLYDHAVIYDLQFSAANPKVAYGLSRTVTEKQADGRYANYSYLYKTTDAGRNFNRVYRTPNSYTSSDDEKEVPSYYMYLPPTPARAESVVYLEQSSQDGSVYYRSTDGGKSFQDIGSTGFDQIAPDGALLKVSAVSCSYNKCQLRQPALRSADNGDSYQPVGEVPGYYIERFILPSQNAGVYYALARPLDPSKSGTTHARLLRSTNGGANWDVLPEGPYLDGDYYYSVYITVSDYSPLTLAVENNLGDNSSKVYLWQDQEADRLQTRPAPAKPGQTYFDLSHHNLSGVFQDYWNSHGGLAQFGYPQTEVFREVNPSDGHIYYTQYFERNRFEFHPENKGTPYEVLLGLLGNQLTASRRAAGEGAFNRFEDMHYSGGSYYPQTGHNLRNSFKAYWQDNGGLAIYGYPISEEFYEVNPDDGKTYLVQYFERARLEYHPENKGTKYEVLLGLMGNTLLKQKGWL